MHHIRIGVQPAIGVLVSTLAAACAPLVHGPATGVERGRTVPAAHEAVPAAHRNIPEASDAATVDVEAEERVELGEELDRHGLVAAVLRRNPSIDAARQAWKAAAARPAQVGALDDPMFSYAFAPGSIDSSVVDYGENVEISQRLPWPGKLRLKSAAAADDADARFQDLEAAKLEMAMKASALFDDYYLVARALELNAEHVRLLEELKRAASAQYAAGFLSQQDPIQAEVELAHLAHQEVVLEAERRVVVARINALLHRPPGADLPPPPRKLAAGEYADAVLGSAGADVAHLEDIAVARRPEIAAADAEIRARAADVSLAGLEGYPDFGVMGQYNSMWAEEQHRWMAGIELNLPIWRQRIRAARAEAEAQLAVAKRKRQAMEDEVRSELRQSYERIVEAHHVLELFETRLLPAADDQLRVSRAGLESGRSSFMSLIDAERNLRDVQLSYEEALASVGKRIAELARQLGCLPGDLPGVLNSPADSGGDLAAVHGGAR